MCLCALILHPLLSFFFNNGAFKTLVVGKFSGGEKRKSSTISSKSCTSESRELRDELSLGNPLLSYHKGAFINYVNREERGREGSLKCQRYYISKILSTQFMDALKQFHKVAKLRIILKNHFKRAILSDKLKSDLTLVGF